MENRSRCNRFINQIPSLLFELRCSIRKKLKKELEISATKNSREYEYDILAGNVGREVPSLEFAAQ